MPFFVTSHRDQYEIADKTLADLAALAALDAYEAMKNGDPKTGGRRKYSNRRSISRIEQPAVMIDITGRIDIEHPSITLLVFQDLSFWLIEKGEVSTYDYPAGSTLSAMERLKNVSFHDILANSAEIVTITNGMRDLLEVPRDVSSPEYYENLRESEPDLSDVEIDAIDRLLKKPGWASDARTSDARTNDARTNGTAAANAPAANTLAAIAETLISGIDDQFFSAADSSVRNWTDAMAADAQATALQALRTDRRIAQKPASFGMVVRILAQEDSGLPDIDIETENYDVSSTDLGAIEKRLKTILDALHRVSNWSGEEWEYNDGAYFRASGYNQEAASIAFFDFSNALSGHLRLSESRALIARLVATGMDAEAAARLVNE